MTTPTENDWIGQDKGPRETTKIRMIVTLESLHPALAHHGVEIEEADFICDDGVFIFVAEGTPERYRVLHLFPKGRVLGVQFIQPKEHAGSVTVDLEFVDVTKVHHFMVANRDDRDDLGLITKQVPATEFLSDTRNMQDADLVIAVMNDGAEWVVKNREGAVTGRMR